MDKQIKINLATMLFLSPLLFLFSGCTNTQKNTDSDNDDDEYTSVGGLAKIFGLADYKLKLTTVPSGKIYFSRSGAYVNGNKLYVHGHVRTLYNVPVVGGHVDIKVFDPDDVELFKSSVYQRPRAVHKSKAQDVSKFRMTVAQRPPQGSRVELWFHREKNKKTGPH